METRQNHWVVVQKLFDILPAYLSDPLFNDA